MDNNRRGMPLPNNVTGAKIVCKFYESPSGCKNLNCQFYHPGTNIANGHSFSTRGGRGTTRGASMPSSPSSYDRGSFRGRGGDHNNNNNSNNNSNSNHKKDRVKKQNDLNDERAAEELDILFGKVSYGTVLNRVSIRILSHVDFKYESADWKPFMKSDQSKINVFYKENDKVKPVSFYFKFSDTFNLKIKSLVTKLAESQSYLETNNNTLHYAWFYNGHILNSYASPKGMFNESLAEGNMKLVKRSYNDDNENYKFYKVVNDKDFKCVYLHDDFQFVSKVLNTKKKQNVSSTASSVGEVEHTCVICLENDNNWILIPCGHKCVCGECAKVIQVCPLCRAKIVSKNIVYE